MRKLACGVLVLGWIPTLALATGAKWIGGGALAAQGRTPVKVTRLYTGPDGKTKVEEFEIPTTPRNAGSDLSASVAVTSLQVRRTTPEYLLDWHPAPRRQLGRYLSGDSEIQPEGGRNIRPAPATPPGAGHDGSGAHLASHCDQGPNRALHRPRRRRDVTALGSTVLPDWSRFKRPGTGMARAIPGNQT